MIVYVQRSGGAITGVFANPQPGIATEAVDDQSAEVVAFRTPPTAAQQFAAALSRAAEEFNAAKTETHLMIVAVALGVIDLINPLRARIVGTVVVPWDAASIPNGAGLTSPNVTVAGAAFGDHVDVAAGISLAGIVAFGYVSAANTVNVRLHNGTGAAVNLANTNWKITVRRESAAAPVTTEQAKQYVTDKIATLTAPTQPAEAKAATAKKRKR